jgi:signal peptidase I
MFGLFASQEKKARENAGNWLELADKVWHFRRDLLSDKESADLLKRAAELREQLKAKADAARLKLSIESLEAVLRRTGGAIYPKTSLVENVEFFLVAAIVILGIRTYFVQPFKIPTNSMWPTYFGMTPEVFTSPADEPNKLEQAGRLLAFGAWPHRLDAPASGEVLIPVGGIESRGIVHSRIVRGRSWLVLPTTLREYTLLVGSEAVRVRVPMDFDFDWAVYDGFFSDGDHYSSRKLASEIQRRLETGQVEVRVIDGERVRCVRTGRRVREGERVFAFDELTGDQLFVDRVSYHFTQPEVGSGFVFRTENIEGIPPPETYYIKRLVGQPGDTLEVRGSTLFRNGSPITGAAAFQANAERQGNYPGYQASGLLQPGLDVRVPADNYFALGDNSPNSSDGRVWGFVPAKDVVGKPLFVYYPFTSRWGPAK